MFNSEIYSVCLLKGNNLVIYTNHFYKEEDAIADYIAVLKDTFENEDKPFTEKEIEGFVNDKMYYSNKLNKQKNKNEQYTLSLNKVDLIAKKSVK